MPPLLAAVLLCLITATGCDAGERGSDATPSPEATSLFGQPLYAPRLSDEIRADRQDKLDAARADYEADPDDPDALIWLGRRTAYLGRYREAIRIFSDGVQRFPEDARMYRHRGHRYVTTRRFADAVADLDLSHYRIRWSPETLGATWGNAIDLVPKGVPLVIFDQRDLATVR